MTPAPTKPVPIVELSPELRAKVTWFLDRSLQSLAARANEKVRLICGHAITEAILRELPGSALSWTFNTEPLVMDPSRFLYFKENLDITDLSPADSGVYTCQVSWGSDDKVKENVTVGVFSLEVETDTASRIVFEYEPTKMDCHSVALGNIFHDASRYWLFNGTRTDVLPVTKASNVTYDVIRSITKSMSGVWECQVFQPRTERIWATAWYNITVQEPPPAVARAFRYVQAHWSTFVIVGVIILVPFILLFCYSAYRIKKMEDVAGDQFHDERDDWEDTLMKHSDNGDLNVAALTGEAEGAKDSEKDRAERERLMWGDIGLDGGDRGNDSRGEGDLGYDVEGKESRVRWKEDVDTIPLETSSNHNKSRNNSQTNRLVKSVGTHPDNISMRLDTWKNNKGVRLEHEHFIHRNRNEHKTRFDNLQESVLQTAHSLENKRSTRAEKRRRKHKGLASKEDAVAWLKENSARIRNTADIDSEQNQQGILEKIICHNLFSRNVKNDDNIVELLKNNLNTRNKCAESPYASCNLDGGDFLDGYVRNPAQQLYPKRQDDYLNMLPLGDASSKSERSTRNKTRTKNAMKRSSAVLHCELNDFTPGVEVNRRNSTPSSKRSWWSRLFNKNKPFTRYNHNSHDTDDHDLTEDAQDECIDEAVFEQETELVEYPHDKHNAYPTCEKDPFSTESSGAPAPLFSRLWQTTKRAVRLPRYNDDRSTSAWFGNKVKYSALPQSQYDESEEL